VSTSQQRRDAERRRLQDQLDERRAREASRRRFTLIASIATTLVVIAAIVVVVIVATKGSDKKTSSAGGSASTVTFQGVTVRNADNIASEPKVTSKGTADPKALQYKDLVVGTGKAAAPSSTVTVQYTGVLYKKGTQFDSSWSSGQPAQFSLAQVVPGFTQGIGGNGSVPPMKVGGRRLMILPPALGYGAQANGTIPANSTLVFVVDLKSVDG
jgi:peptidylprolyl isomerase